MFDLVIGFVQVAVVIVAGIVSFRVARRFVSERLRFVDAVRSPFAPPIAGLGAFLLAWPVAVLLPYVPGIAAAAFGIGAAAGTSSGVRRIVRGEWSSRQLRP